LPPADVARLMALAARPASNTLTIALDAQTIRAGDVEIGFAIDAVRKQALLQGLDAIGHTLTMRADILAFQQRHLEANPWFR
jgi:3-isopropylmalate/(R)-2-methylmalate dehydratase small subunit